MELYFSTIFRYAPSVDQAGELVKLDWDSKKVIKRVPFGQKTLQFEDPNPRGNSRGGRGIAVIGDRVVAAGYCELQVYDRDLNYLYAISHNLMAGIHEVFNLEDGRLWITSTTLNAALLIDINTGELLDQIWPQEIVEFQMRWKIAPNQLDKTADNRARFVATDIFKNKSHLHFNAITEWNGNLYGLFNRFGAVVNLSEPKIVLEDPFIKGAHNLHINEDGTIFVNNTRNQTVNLYDMNGRRIKRINLLPLHQTRRKVPVNKLFSPIRKLTNQVGLTRQQFVSVFHVRGLDIRNELLYCGISPAAILCLNWRNGKVVDTFDYSDDNRIAIHGLKFA